MAIGLRYHLNHKLLSFAGIPPLGPGQIPPPFPMFPMGFPPVPAVGVQVGGPVPNQPPAPPPATTQSGTTTEATTSSNPVSKALRLTIDW